MYRYYLIPWLLLIALIGQCCSLLLVAPKVIRPQQNYTVVISHFGSNENIQLSVRMEGIDAGAGKPSLNLTKLTTVKKNANAVIELRLPDQLAQSSSYKLIVDGRQGFRYHRETDLELKSNTLTGLIQLSQPVYKPGDTVQFRAIVLDSELRPAASTTTTTTDSVRVTVEDPNGNVIRRWPTARLQGGVFASQLTIATTPLLGDYSINVASNEGQRVLASKSFAVQEYVLTSFDVDVQPATIPLEVHQGLNLTVTARYNVGLPVQGTARVEVYLEDDILDQSRTVQLIGSAVVQLPFQSELLIAEDGRQGVRVNVTFTEQLTNRTISKQRYITVYKHQYRVELQKETPTFRRGSSYACSLKVVLQDGRPVRDVTVNVIVDGLKEPFDKRFTTDSAGIIKLMLPTSNSTEYIIVEALIDGNHLLEETIDAAQYGGEAMLKVAMETPLKLHHDISLLVTCSKGTTFYLYYVLSRGSIIDSGYVPLGKGLVSHRLQLKPSDRMLPKSTVIVATIVTASQVVLYDFVELDYQALRNNFTMKLDKTVLKPGQELRLRMTGLAGSYVALAAYDKSLLQFGQQHDLFWKDALAVLAGFHAIDDNSFDLFQRFGLIVQTLDGVSFDSGNTKTGREGKPTSKAKGKSTAISFRSNFLESFLWKTITMPAAGSTELAQTVPDTTTAWQLTGFSIDPVYGLGIIEQPLQFITVQQFYIVDSLPYSIKRGEAVVLQFSLFSQLSTVQTAQVTLYTGDNRTEIVGQPVTAQSLTKTVTVPANVGVPVTFLVKARAIGEMVVRIKAVCSSSEVQDELEKVIRVVPESLIQRRHVSRFFSHSNYANQTFAVVLDIDKQADERSRRIEFTLVPNLLTSVLKNLGNLLSVPSGCGEQNMVRYVPNILVLDYLTAIGSGETHLISRATELLRVGHQNQLRFRQPDGSFGLWSASGGGVFLTAFVGSSMKIASKYIADVEPSIVRQAFDWLATKQHTSGRFDAAGAMYHRDMQGGLRDGIALTAYVLIAFLENPEAARNHPKVIEKGMQYVTEAVPRVTDAYDLSIATYALWLASHPLRFETLDRLTGLSTTKSNGTERYWARAANGIETTAYALLSYVLAERYLDGVPIMRWLVGQRYETGSFPRTQDTFVGLKALCKMAEKVAPARNDYSIQLVYPQRRREFRVSSGDLEQMSYDEFTDATNKLEFHVQGTGFGLLQVSYQYAMELSKFANQFVLDVTKRDSGSTETKLVLDVCTSYKPKLTNERSNMVLVEVNFPSGYVAEKSPLSATTTVNPIRNVEIRFGGTSVVLYYDNMGTERNCFAVTAYRRTRVALNRPAYVIVHDYYEPEKNAVKTYEVERRDVCELCDGNNECREVCQGG
ncbi:thioester-containing protein [Anopheles darlingi]|uniref:TEP1-F n=1 Tax=Anopheles darlingi TaxID=43151 RepID=W5J8L8_ANODA|nr:thioester-containing protein [Anopheles darlingi]